MFEGVESNHPNRVVKLPGEEVGDNGFEVGALDLDFAVKPFVGPTLALDNEVDGLIRPIRYIQAISWPILGIGNLQRDGSAMAQPAGSNLFAALKNPGTAANCRPLLRNADAVSCYCTLQAGRRAT